MLLMKIEQFLKNTKQLQKCKMILRNTNSTYKSRSSSYRIYKRSNNIQNSSYKTKIVNIKYKLALTVTKYLIQKPNNTLNEHKQFLENTRQLQNAK